jgi:hypothetical protein
LVARRETSGLQEYPCHISAAKPRPIFNRESRNERLPLPGFKNTGNARHYFANKKNPFIFVLKNKKMIFN